VGKRHVDCLGAPAKLVSENADIQAKINEAQEAGVLITACKACAGQLGVTGSLEEQGIEVTYWGGTVNRIIAEWRETINHLIWG
jgi:hypothetical protein